MLQLFSNLKTFVKSNRRSTESLVFFLNYKVTFLLLIFCCILISTQHIAGRKIDCLLKPNGEINVEVLNSYCWAASTYSVSSAYLKEVGLEVPHPGVESSEDGSQYEYRNFYQYVHILIFIQAAAFYVPHMLWKNFEENAMCSTYAMVKSFNTAITDGSTASKDGSTDSDEKMDALAAHMEVRWGSYKPLVLKYLFCEFLSSINVLAQSYLLDIFFRGKFMGMGLLVDAYYSSALPSDPIRLFPIVTICHFYRYGPSGAIDVFDSLCVLPFNALNAKIYLCLWIWFVILLLLSILSNMHLLASITLSSYRKFSLKSIICQVNCSTDTYTQLISRGDFGDWFVASAVKNNMDEFDFSRFAENLLSKLNSLAIETKEP